MSAAVPTARPSLSLYLLIGGLSLSDFLQSGVVAFNAAPIMGDIGAGPEEYSLVATLYAVVAIGMIFNHRWLLERFGWRNFMASSCVAFATGAVGCALSESLTQFAVARIVMALGTSSFFTAGRILVNHIPPSPRRFVGVKFLASGVAWGAVLGPLVASLAYSHGSWRHAFLALLVPATVLGVLSIRLLPSSPVEPQGKPRPLLLLTLIAGSFLLLHGLQRSNFVFFAETTTLTLSILLAVPILALVIWMTRLHDRPVLGFGALAQKRFLVGLSVYFTCYLVIGANNTMLPLLLRGLNLPLETVDRVLAIGALGGVFAWIVLSRILPRWPGPTRYYLASFALLGFSGWALAGLSESAHPVLGLVPALLANGAFVIGALSTTALQTFQTLQKDEVVFSHANQVKNILSQLGTAMGLTLAMLLVQWRGALHQTRLAEAMTSTNPAFAATLDSLVKIVGSTGDVATAQRISMAQLATMLTQESSLLAVLDYFCLLGRFSLIVLALALVERGLRQWRAAGR